MRKNVHVTAIAPGIKDFLTGKRFARLTSSKFTQSLDQLKFQCLVEKAPTQLPIACVTAMADKIGKGCWMRADPINLAVDLVHIFQMGASHLKLSLNETREIVNEINHLLKDYQLALIAPNPMRWYLRCAESPKIKTVNPEEILGKSITDYLLKGPDAPFWLRLTTEVQMLLHDCEVNRKRGEKGLPTVDALWFWGQGEPNKLKPKHQYNGIISDDPVINGLAEFLKIPFDAEFNNPEPFHEGKYLICTDLFVDKVESQLTAQHQGFLTLFKQICNEKKLSLVLYPGDEHCYYVSARNMRSWWKLW